MSVKQITQQIASLSQELVALKHEYTNKYGYIDPLMDQELYGDEVFTKMHNLEDHIDDLESKISDLEEELDDEVNTQYNDDEDNF